MASLAAGLGLIAAAQLVAPVGSPPLYDGVIVQDPYRYLAPGQGQTGSPTSYRASLPVGGGTSPQFVAATTENPPQAQLIADSGAFVLPAGTTSLTVSIEPVAVSTPASSGQLTGNAYQVSVTDQSGTDLSIGSTTSPTVILRAPDGVFSGVISRLVGATWQGLPTEQGGQPGIFLSNVTELGEFAVIEPDQGLIGFVLSGVSSVVVSLVAIVGYFVWRRSKRRQRPPPEPLVRSSSTKRRKGGRRRRGSR